MIKGVDPSVLDWIDKTLQIPDIRHVDFIRHHVDFIKTKDPVIRNKLIMSHLKIIIKPALYYYRRSSGDDIFFELINESVIAMCKALKVFNPSAGVYFASFVRQRIWRACYWFYQKRYPKYLQNSVSLDNDKNGIDLKDLIARNDLTIENILSNDDYNWLTKNLNVNEKQMIDSRYVEDKSWITIAKKMKLTKRALAYRKNKILEKIKTEYATP